MTRLWPCLAMLLVTVVAMVSSGQDRSLWHGRIFGIADSYGNNGRTRSLTYTDLENISQRGTLSTDSELIYALDSISATI